MRYRNFSETITAAKTALLQKCLDAGQAAVWTNVATATRSSYSATVQLLLKIQLQLRQPAFAVVRAVAKNLVPIAVATKASNETTVPKNTIIYRSRIYRSQK